MFEIVKIKEGAGTGRFAWNLRLTGGGRIIAVSEQHFSKRSQVQADIARVKKLAPDAAVVEVLG